MNLYPFLVSLILSLAAPLALSQELEWSFPQPNKQPFIELPGGEFLADSLGKKLAQWRDSYRILPKYARKNPTGYTFLCRLELKGEEKLPIPVWIKVDDQNSYSNPSYPHTYLRFKLLRF